MAQRKAKKGGGKGTAARSRKRPGAGRKTPARKAAARKTAAGKAAGAGAAAARRIAALEAENGRLRAALDALRGDQTSPEAVDDAADGPPVLGL